MVPHPPEGPRPRGVVRLFNTAAGRVLCLAGDVDAVAVSAFLDRYGREPVRIDVIDTRSVTRLSVPALALVGASLAAADRAGRRVALRGGFPRESAQAAAQAADGFL